MALIALSVVFLTWVTLSIELNPPEMSENNPMAYLFIIAILALVFGSALSIKRISDAYGFKFRGQGQVKKTQQKAQIKAKPKKGKR